VSQASADSSDQPRTPIKIAALLRSGHLIDSRAAEIGLLICLAFALELAAGTGLAYIAGFASVQQVLPHFWTDWTWLAGVAGSLAVSFYGYYLAYDGIFSVEAGPQVPGPRMRAIVAAGFGGFLSHGGPALDGYALEAAGASKRDASVRVTGLAGLEHGVLAIGVVPAAITVLATGSGAPPPDFTLPWAIIPVPGFLLGFWLAERYRARLRDRPGLRGKAGVFLDGIHLIRTLFLAPGKDWPAAPGMALFWATDMLAAWLGLAAFGYRMNAATFIVAMGTGMVFTRRTGPLAGAGVLTLVLPQAYSPTGSSPWRCPCRSHWPRCLDCGRWAAAGTPAPPAAPGSPATSPRCGATTASYGRLRTGRRPAPGCCPRKPCRS
jgi:hypothetical protein